jgi:ABC-type Fe3+-hydroxamate transport system substrate-binding protein
MGLALRSTLLLLACAGPAASQTTVTQSTTQREDVGTSPVIRGDGLKRTVFCNRGRVTVHGRGNEIVMRGPCERVAVFGSDHRIAIEEVGSLSLQGSGHVVSWVRGLDGKPPTIGRHGEDVSVKRISPEEFASLPVPTERQ